MKMKKKKKQKKIKKKQQKKKKKKEEEVQVEEEQAEGALTVAEFADDREFRVMGRFLADKRLEQWRAVMSIT